MKYIFYLIITLILFSSCNTDENNPLTDDDEIVNINLPEANDDEFITESNGSLVITTLLDNDIIFEFGRISSFSVESEKGGTISDQGDNTLIYTPNDGFTGIDTFSYELCDASLPANCSNGIVTIEVVDLLLDFSAIDDNIFLENNMNEFTINVLVNDFLADSEGVDSINTTETLGEVTLNTDGTINYISPIDFFGTDVFSYTICNGSEVEVCDTAQVYITVADIIDFNIDSNLFSYYSDVQFINNSTLLLEELTQLTKNSQTTILGYTQRHNYLYDADADLGNEDNVVLMYSSEIRADNEWVSGLNSNDIQTYNTEHVYPQSFLPGNNQEDPSTRDLHNLRVCDASINTSRSNNPFGDGEGDFGYMGSTWYPGDEWRGDVARIVMYMNMYYGEPFSDVGNLDLFLEWNIEDPVSDFEKQRNDIFEEAQGNRNPFIDNPYLATLIWGGEAGENTWE